jgi:hypothetical protein
VTAPKHVQPPRCHLTVVVAVDQLNPAVLAAVRYAELLRPTRLSGFHVDLDQEAAVGLCRAWNEHFGGRVPLVVADPAGRSLAETFARTVIDDLPDRNHPVVVIVPARWGPEGELPTSTHQMSEVVARLATIDDVVVFVVPALDAPQEYGDGDIEDELDWAMARHELRRNAGIPPSSR